MKRIQESKIGLIFHNHYYEGEDIESLLELWEMNPREGVKEDLKDTKDVVVFSKEVINEIKLDVAKLKQFNEISITTYSSFEFFYHPLLL